MKAVIGEYGKVIILAVVLGMLVLFLFGRGNHGFLGMISKARPEAAVGNEDSFAMAQTVFSRKAPELSVSVRKLQKGREYNLLDSGLFEIRAVNPEGEEVPVTIDSSRAAGYYRGDRSPQVCPFYKRGISDHISCRRILSGKYQGKRKEIFCPG